MAGTFERPLVLVEPADAVHGSASHVRAIECRCGALIREGRQADHERMIAHTDQPPDPIRRVDPRTVRE